MTHYFWTQSDPFALKKFFSRKTINVISIYFLASFIVQNLKKKNPWRGSRFVSNATSDLYPMHHLWAQNDLFTLKKNPLAKEMPRKSISKILLHLLASFHCPKFLKNLQRTSNKKNLRVDLYIVMMLSLGPKQPISSAEVFFQKNY